MLLGICAGLTLALVLFTIDAYYKGKRTDERKRRKYHKIKREVEREHQRRLREARLKDEVRKQQLKQQMRKRGKAE